MQGTEAIPPFWHCEVEGTFLTWQLQVNETETNSQFVLEELLEAKKSCMRRQICEEVFVEPFVPRGTLRSVVVSSRQEIDVLRTLDIELVPSRQAYLVQRRTKFSLVETIRSY